MICQNCEYTDGVVYTSMPPKVRCTITNDYHEYSHKCEMEWKPVVMGKWIDGFCSVCHTEAITEWNDVGGEYALSNFCHNCGAKMEVDNG